jgi:hypothetical protein
MDYPNKARMKIFARMSTVDLASDPALAERLASPGYKATPERAFILKLQAFDWNCPQHITQRFTLAELDEAVTPLRHRLAELESENRTLRAQLAKTEEPGP